MIAVTVAMQLVVMLVSQLVVIRILGIGEQSDAYIASQAVPSVVSAIVISSLQSVWMPRFSILHQDLITRKVQQSLAQGQGVILGGSSLLLLMSTVSFWLPVLYPGFSDDVKQTTTIYSLVLLGATALNIQTALLTVALRAYDRFLTAEVIGLVSSSIALLAVWILVPKWGAWSAVWIMMARSIVMYLVLMHISSWPLPDIAGGLRFVDTWRTIQPLLFSGSLSKTAPLFDRYWASQAQAGSLTVLGLAQQGISAMSTVLERSISMPLIPALSRLLKCGEIHTLRIRYRQRVVIALLATVVIAGVLITARHWIVDALILTLNFSSDDAEQMRKILIALTGFLFVSIAGSVVISVLYALGEMSLAAKISIGGFLVGLILKWLAFDLAGVVGIAVAITTSYLFTFVVGVALVEMKLRGIEKTYD